MTYLRSISVRAPAKVNPQFGVGWRRDDGYHELASVFLAVSLSDRITLTAAEELRVTVGGPGAANVPADGSNIAARAVELLAKRSGLHPGVHVHIDKHIPVQGGMAGGSADAAGALVGCDALWNLGLGRPELMSPAAELGSDVPFSLLGGAAFGSGSGERLTVHPVGATTHWVGTDADALAGILCGSGATIGFIVSDGDQARTVAQKLLASGTCASVHIAAGPVPRPEPEEIITRGENG
ncbi:4-(cytidine 5'-diphospho)-2-C-methyl-D-erythritol kinase [Streptomyces sp. NPDC048551]|uniref:4-(cytidine 5'-diphospho)-2-C-methyl-D-erythritol kinase n=1 Tax=Streptomyces sp. NPDC048551 TaxID=3155758 RepID=UPI0034420AC3